MSLPPLNANCPLCQNFAWHGAMQVPIGGHHPSCEAVRVPLESLFDVGDTTSDLKDAETVGESSAAVSAASAAGGSTFANVVSAAGEGAAYGAVAASIAVAAAATAVEIAGGVAVGTAVASGVGIGAAAGETVGPWGAVIGAVVGVIVGLIVGFAPKDKPYVAVDPLHVLAMLCGHPYMEKRDGKTYLVDNAMKNYKKCLDWSRGTTVEVEGSCQPGEMMMTLLVHDGWAAKAFTLWSANDQFHDFVQWYVNFGNGKSPGYKAIEAYLRSRPEYWTGWDPKSIGGANGDDINGGGASNMPQMMPHPLYWFCQCVSKIAYAAGEHKASHESGNRPFQAFETKLGWLNSDLGGRLLEDDTDDSNMNPEYFFRMADILHDICVRLQQESKIEKAAAAAAMKAKRAVAKVTAPSTGMQAVARVAPSIAKEAVESSSSSESSWKRPAILAGGAAVAAGAAYAVYRKVLGTK